MYVYEYVATGVSNRVVLFFYLFFTVASCVINVDGLWLLREALRVWCASCDPPQWLMWALNVRALASSVNQMSVKIDFHGLSSYIFHRTTDFTF